MSEEYVVEVGRIAASLGIEIGATCAETSVANDLHPSLYEFELIDRELVGIPAVLHITTIGIDRTEHTIVDSHCKFVFECVTGKSGMVNFDIHLEVLVKAVSAKEADDSFGIHIILMLAWFHWLRFDKECAVEALGTRVVASHAKHSCHVLFFTLLVGVKKAHITFTTAPENIVFSTESYAGIDCVLDLNYSASYYIEIGVGRSSIHISLVAKYVSSRPKQLDASLLHLLL